MPKRKDLKKIMIIGAGPIVIGQACEFDYSGAQACKALKEEGYKVILVNSVTSPYIYLWTNIFLLRLSTSKGQSERDLKLHSI